MTIARRIRRSLRDIPTFSGKARHTHSPDQAYMKLSCIEREYKRLCIERESVAARLHQLENCVSEICAAKAELLSQLKNYESEGIFVNPRSLGHYTEESESEVTGFKLQY
jgi:hypothetical protein